MSIDNIMRICDNECSVFNLHAHAHKHSSIESQTIRTKGQLLILKRSNEYYLNVFVIQKKNCLIVQTVQKNNF